MTDETDAGTYEFESIELSVVLARLNIEVALSHILDGLKHSEGEAFAKFDELARKLFEISDALNAMELAGAIRDPSRPTN
jgi:hypothetical protein